MINYFLSHIQTKKNTHQVQKEVEFSALKAALFKDLENRCQKVFFKKD